VGVQDTPGNKGSVQCEAPGAFQKVDSLAIFMMFLCVLFVSLALVAWLWNHIARSFNGAMQREAAARPPLKATTASGALQPAAVVKSPGKSSDTVGERAGHVDDMRWQVWQGPS
jgi:hypothetical protein